MSLSPDSFCLQCSDALVLQRYDRFCNGAPDMPTSAVNDALAAAFCFGHNPRSQEELLALLDIDRNGSISRDEFYRAARRAGEVERWLLRLPLASIVSDAISAALTFSSASPEDDPLRQLSALTSEQVSCYVLLAYNMFRFSHLRAAARHHVCIPSRPLPVHRRGYCFIAASLRNTGSRHAAAARRLRKQVFSL